MRRVFGIVALFALTLARSFATDATFSNDGKHVYAIQFESSKLTVIDIEKQTASEVDLGSFINKQPIVALSTSKSGDVLVTTAHDAWSCNLDKKSCRKLCSAPEGLEFREIGYNPDNGSILFSTRDGRTFQEKPDLDRYRAAFVLEHGEGNLFPVSTNRVQFIDGIAFTPKGDVFFGSQGDLWQGSVGEVDLLNKTRKEMGEQPLPPAPGEPAQYAYLAARRCAPLANLETSRITPKQIGVSKVAISSAMVYVHLLRMYGTGFGEIVRLPAPPGIDENSDEGVQDGLDDRLKLYAKESSSVESLAENEFPPSYLCASLDGKRVFFRGGKPRGYGFYLVENNGKPRELNVRLPGQAAPTASPTPQKHAQPSEKEPDYIQRLQQQIKELFPSPTPRATQKQ